MTKKSMTRKKKRVNQGSIVVPESAKRPREMRVASLQRETRLELPVGEPDLQALRSVTREWLVPRLVEKFLRQAGIELRAANTIAAPTTLANTYSEKCKYTPH